MDKQKIVRVGAKQYLVAISEADDKWHALVAPMPPADGRTYNLPQWHCNASSESVLNEKIEQHFQDVMETQESKN